MASKADGPAREWLRPQQVPKRMVVGSIAWRTMRVGREEGPGGDGEGVLPYQPGQVGHEVSPVRVVVEDDPPLPSPHRYVVRSVRDIEAEVAGHGRRKPSTGRRRLQRTSMTVPQCRVARST